MKSVTVSVEIKASREAVFAMAVDIPNFAKNISGITKVEELTEGPSAVGKKWRETRVMFGKEASEEMWFSRFEPPKGCEVRAESNGAKYLTTMTMEALGASETKVTVTFSGEAQTFMAKVMGFVMGPLMVGTIKKCLVEDLEDLKKNLEKA